ncbi:MAG TPA: hydantoinase/oxoprolinase family protein [Trueperaceae bacterium]|nr:hydantoinase/oxoprolinase family protein [Trueperaceae bacterium]
MIRIGIDVGGTNTDAVVMSDRTVLHSVKTVTTEDVMSGVVTALRQVLSEGAVAEGDVDVVMIGTTHFTNAVVQRRDLAPTAAVRLGLPATASLVPMVDWPPDLREAIGNHAYLAHGGHEFDGRTISELDVGELRRIGQQIASHGIRTVAISSVFSPVNTEMEQRARDVLGETLPGAHFTLSSEIGRIGLLERENAAIMNACLRDLSRKTVTAFRDALRGAGLDAPFFLTQNDGTLMNAETAEEFPVLTFASGPTNSMRGAAFLSGIKDAIVIDVGGTTTDIGALVNGFPREASIAVEVGGVRTNFRMPDVFSIGLGGGSLVAGDPVRVGPQSVGYRLTQEARVFGGDSLTATDVAVAAGRADIGDARQVVSLDRGVVEAALETIREMVERAVERMRLTPEPVPVIVVGGGSILVPDRVGELNVIRPDHYPVANAVGAAIAQISGEVDRVFSLAEMPRDEAVARAKAEAIERAIQAGADQDSTQIVDVDDVPLAYLPGNATRIRVKAVGDLSVA